MIAEKTAADVLKSAAENLAMIARILESMEGHAGDGFADADTTLADFADAGIAAARKKAAAAAALAAHSAGMIRDGLAAARLVDIATKGA